MLRDTLPPANVIMMAGPTAQQKAESVMNMLGVAPASAAAASVHFSPRLSSSGNGTARRSPSPSSRPLGQHVSTQGEQHEQQLQHEEKEDCGGSSSSSRSNGTAGGSEQQTAGSAPSVTADTQQVLACSAQDTTQPPSLASDVVVGVPVKMPAVGIPVDAAVGPAVAVTRSSAVGNNGDVGSTQQASAALPAVFDSAVQVQGCFPSADKQGSVAQPGCVANAQQAPGTKEGFAAPAAATGEATAAGVAPAAVPNATPTAAAATTTDKAKGQLEPQVLLAALKLTPAQPQQALGGSKGDSGSSSAGGSAPARGSSSGGMAPGTPVLGSLGGSGSSGGSNGGLLTKPARGRDESAGGVYSNALARKLSAGSGLLPAPSAPGQKPGSSPLSRAQPSEKDSSNSAGATADSSISQGTTLQELASQLGCSPDKAVQQLRVSGLQTVPAYFYGTADNRNVAGDVRRPGSSSSSYSQKYQKKVIKLASQDAAAALPPELLELMNSLAAADGSSGSSGSSGGSTEPSSFAQLKAAWLAKESASREASGAGARPGNSGSLRASAAGAGQDGGASAAGGQSAPSEPLLLSLSSSLVAPGTPVHSQLHPFATMGSLLSQYSNAQLLNARMQHSLTGDGSGLSINGGPHGLIGDPLPKATGDEACSSSSGAVAAVAVQPGPGLSDKHVLLLVKDPAASSTRESIQGVGQGESSQALAACSSILSLPDAAAGAAAVARDSCNGCPQAQTVEKVEVLLEGTRSVPFELVLSPRSKYLIASSTAGGCGTGPTSIDVNSPLGQHLLQLVLAGRLSEGASGQGAAQPFSLSLTQWQQLQQQQERQAVQCAAEPAVVMATPAGPSVGVPVGHSSSAAVDAVTQVLAGPGCSPEVPSASAGAAAGAAPCCSSPSGAQAAPAAAPAPVQLGASGQLVLSLLRPSAASPRLADSNAGTPVWGSPSSSRHQLATPQQQQQVPAAAAAAAAASSSAATGSFGSFVVAPTASPGQDLDRPSLSATGAVAAALGAASPHQQQQQQPQQQQPQQQQLVLSPSPFQQQERQSLPRQQQPVSDGGAGDLAAELVALLQSAGSMSPEEKADRVARTFAKTISRLNM